MGRTKPSPVSTPATESTPEGVLTDEELKNYGREMQTYLVGSLKVNPKKAREIVRSLVRVVNDQEDNFIRI